MKYKAHHDASHMLPNGIFWEAMFRNSLSNSLILLARPERFELQTLRFEVRENYFEMIGDIFVSICKTSNFIIVSYHVLSLLFINLMPN
jgi:hypothetical protein